MTDTQSSKMPFPPKPVNLILDTDMGNDIDDGLALAMIHTLEARGECRLLGVVISKDNPYAPAMVDAINTFYGRGDVAIGMVQNGVTKEVGHFNQTVIEMKNEDGKPLFPTTHKFGSYEPAVVMLRRQLASAEDHSVVIIPIGFSTNLHQLFDSPTDAISPLNGKDLFALKVSHVVMMAGNFTDIALNKPNTHKEYNIITDLPAAKRFIHECPVPIYFTGAEVGFAILHPVRSILEDYAWCSEHPVVEGYKRYMQMPYDRPTWDLTAVLFAVRPKRGYFNIIGPGHVRVDDEGLTHFTQQTPADRYILAVTPQQIPVIREVQVDLSSQPILR